MSLRLSSLSSFVLSRAVGPEAELLLVAEMAPLGGWSAKARNSRRGWVAVTRMTRVVCDQWWTIRIRIYWWSNWDLDDNKSFIPQLVVNVIDSDHAYNSKGRTEKSSRVPPKSAPLRVLLGTNAGGMRELFSVYTPFLNNWFIIIYFLMYSR